MCFSCAILVERGAMEGRPGCIRPVRARMQARPRMVRYVGADLSRQVFLSTHFYFPTKFVNYEIFVDFSSPK